MEKSNRKKDPIFFSLSPLFKPSPIGPSLLSLPSPEILFPPLKTSLHAGKIGSIPIVFAESYPTSFEFGLKSGGPRSSQKKNRKRKSQWEVRICDQLIIWPSIGGENERRLFFSLNLPTNRRMNWSTTCHHHRRRFSLLLPTNWRKLIRKIFPKIVTIRSHQQAKKAQNRLKIIFLPTYSHQIPP